MAGSKGRRVVSCLWLGKRTCRPPDGEEFGDEEAADAAVVLGRRMCLILRWVLCRRARIDIVDVGGADGEGVEDFIEAGAGDEDLGRFGGAVIVAGRRSGRRRPRARHPRR